MPEPAEYRIAPDFAAERPCTIVAFDGDDTLWIDDTEEKRWERECKRLCVAGLPHPDMANAFHRHVSAFRLQLQEGVQRALVESGGGRGIGDIPGVASLDIVAIPGWARRAELALITLWIADRPCRAVRSELDRATYPSVLADWAIIA